MTYELIVFNPIVNKPSIAKEDNMSLPHTHPLRAEGYCEICKRNFRDMGRHMLDVRGRILCKYWRVKSLVTER